MHSNILKDRIVKSRLILLILENNDLIYAVPGGLIGVGLTVDPTLTRSNKLVGQVLISIS